MEGTDGEARVPARRSRSEPRGRDGPRDPASFYAFPSTLLDILYGPRQRLTKYADGMQALPCTPSPVNDTTAAAAAAAADPDANADAATGAADTTPEVRQPAKAIDVGTETAAERSAAGEDASARAPPIESSEEEHQQQQQQQQTAAEQEEKLEAAAATITSGAAAEADGSAALPTESAARTAETPETRDAAEAPRAAQEGDAEADLPQLRVPAETVAFDPAQIATWMREYRHSTAHVPAGVERFVAELHEHASRLGPLRLGGTSPTPSAAATAAAGKKGKKGSVALSAVGSPKLGTGSLADMPSRDAGGFGSSVAGRSGASSAAPANAVKRSNALEALGDVWEGRQDMPISLTQGSLRRRGLFGEVEKKEIHHMVVSVLNKVTTDPGKFREVKNELLRLPIPESNAEQLTKIVDAFFNKAVREQHFSHSYADLIVALCKVPQGQHIVGDRTQSLEYRLRSALLKRCQSEFVQSTRAEGVLEAGSSPAPAPDTDSVSSPLTSAIEAGQMAGAETEKERRERMCGNVRFVCELFLREIVAASVISVIIRICCLGSEFGEFVLPPAYTPTESQVDEVITAVNTVKDRYFVQSPEGRRMLPLLVGQLEYWVKHYSISRCRFVLMSVVDELRAMLPRDATVPTVPSAPPPLMLATPQLTHRSPPTHSPPPPAPQLQPASQSLPQQPSESTEQALLAAASTLSASASATASASAFATATTIAIATATASPTAVAPDASSPLLSAVDGIAQLSMNSTLVGGQPLPAPRSKQVGSVSLSDSAGSINGAAQAESPMTTSIARPIVTLASRTLLQTVRPEAIAKLMAAFSSGQCTAEEVAGQLFDTYGNVLPAIGAWMDRCLSVVKEEKTRKQTGAMLVACAAHLTANTNASEQEVAETVGACREQLHEAAIEALQRAVATRLYEDLHVFQFWAQLVLSDHARVLYDEELLNEGLEMLVCMAPPAVRPYLVEVGKYMTQVLAAPEKLPWQPSAEPQNFVRYRPLLVLHSLVLKDGPKAAQALLDNLVGFSDVRQQSLELRLYHAFRTGSPTREVVFEQLRTSPRLTSRDATLAAEVLSALLIAELCSSAEALVEDSMDLMLLTVDGVNRAEREMAVVAEVYEVLRYSPRELTMSAAARVLRKFVYMNVISNETMERADQFYEPDGEAAAAVAAVADRPDGLHPGGGDGDLDDDVDDRGLLAPPSADYPRIMNRRGTEDTTLSASMSLRSTNGASPNNANGILHHLHGGGSVDGVMSSSASSFAEFRPRDRLPPRRDTDSERHSQRRMSHSNGSFVGARGGEGSSKQLYRNTYRNRRRSQGEGGSEAHSSAGGSKDATPQQHSMGPGSPHLHYSSHHDGGRGHHGGGDDSRYDRPHGGGRGGRGSGVGGSYEHGRGGGSRGNGRGGAPGRGGGGGGRGGSGRGGGGGISREDSRRASDGVGRGGGGGGNRYGTRPPNTKP